MSDDRFSVFEGCGTFNADFVKFEKEGFTHIRSRADDAHDAYVKFKGSEDEEHKLFLKGLYTALLKIIEKCLKFGLITREEADKQIREWCEENDYTPEEEPIDVTEEFAIPVIIKQGQDA